MRVKSYLKPVATAFVMLSVGFGGLLLTNYSATGAAKAAAESVDKFVPQAGGNAPSVLEKIGRALIAVPRSETEIYVGWRLLGTDAPTATFNLYRSTNGEAAVKLNSEPIAATTDYIDSTANTSQSNAYFVRPVVGGAEQEISNTFTLPANAPVQPYLTVPLQRPAGGTASQPGSTVGASNYTYNANDATVADLDGDGEYEIILKWDPSNSRDTASAGLSGPVLIDAYKMDGTRLWRIDLGKNIRAGAHYTQFLVYDFDGDGKAELACKTADGTIDGAGAVVGDATKDYRSLIVPTDSDIPVAATNDARFGKIISGPEFLTVFNGETGAAMATTNYVPSRYPLDSWGGVGGNGNNDTTGNRVDRFLAAVAYLDGVRPSIVMARGYYGRSVLAAWDWRDGQLTSRWVFDSVNRANPFSGQGAHSLSVANVDDDAGDEIIYHAMTVDDNGTGLYSTGLRHGDATHVSDLDPTRPGLEIFGVHETEATSNPAFQSPGSTLHDAKTGAVLWTNNPATDVGRGVCADIDPNFVGAECWGAPGGARSISTGLPIYAQAPLSPASANFLVWWDGDLLREQEDGTVVTKWNPATRTSSTLLSATGTASNNGTKSTPALTADLLGDWREEVMWRASDNNSLRIYTTTAPATNRLFTLMHDRQYRMAIAWQNVGYNQPPHPSFYIGTGMEQPAPPNIVTSFVSGTNTVSGSPRVGRTVTYTIVLKNDGTFAQQDNPGNEFQLDLPAELIFQTASATNGFVSVGVDSGDEKENRGGAYSIFWNGGIPANGGAVTITIQAAVSEATEPGAVITTQGTINYDADGNGTNELSTVTDNPAVAGNRNATSFRALVPTAAAVAISGKVMDSRGRGISQATVTATDSDGTPKTVRTNAFGYYKLDQLPAGNAYVFTVRSRQHQFEPQVVNLNGDLDGFDFTAQP